MFYHKEKALKRVKHYQKNSKGKTSATVYLRAMELISPDAPARFKNFSKQFESKDQPEYA